MNSIRKWLYKPKKTDQSLLAQFFYADEELNTVATELDSFDGRKDPDRCTSLVNHLRQCQDKVLGICQLIMDEVIPDERAARDFRAKFPDDVLQENLAGQLWFGAECLSAGSNILNRELESASMRPLAKALTKSLENVRNLLREQCFRSPPEFTEKICECLKILDRLFAEFELSYVSAMVPVKSIHEYEAQQGITVLFSETLQRALKLELLSQEQVDSCDPALMFTIPRLAILCGLLVFPCGPLCLESGELSEMFRPFRSLLFKIRELLWTLDRSELASLERSLCSVEDSSSPISPPTSPNNRPVSAEICRNVHNLSAPIPSHAIQDYLDQFYKDYPQCKQFISEVEEQSNSSEGLLASASSVDKPTSSEQYSKDAEREKLNFETETKSECSEDWDNVEEEWLNKVYTDMVDEEVIAVTPIRDNPASSSSRDSGLSSMSGSSGRNKRSTNRSTPQYLMESLFLLDDIGNSMSTLLSSGPVVRDPRNNDSRGMMMLMTCTGHYCSECGSGSSNCETSSCDSECQGDMEIALAMQAAEIASRNEVRARYNPDLIHRLFICISGVADQLQTNYAADLRSTLKCVFAINATPSEVDEEEETEESDEATEADDSGSLDGTGLGLDLTPEPSLHEEEHSPVSCGVGLGVGIGVGIVGGGGGIGSVSGLVVEDEAVGSSSGVISPPTWVPDDLAPNCMGCSSSFTVMRRRHHCRNCGKVFCGKCSGNSVPLPRFGHSKPVRVCNRCYVYSVTPFTLPNS